MDIPAFGPAFASLVFKDIMTKHYHQPRIRNQAGIRESLNKSTGQHREVLFLVHALSSVRVVHVDRNPMGTRSYHRMDSYDSARGYLQRNVSQLAQDRPTLFGVQGNQTTRSVRYRLQVHSSETAHGSGWHQRMKIERIKYHIRQRYMYF